MNTERFAGKSALVQSWQSVAVPWARFLYRFLKNFTFTEHFGKPSYLDCRCYSVEKAMLSITQDMFLEGGNLKHGCLKQLSSAAITYSSWRKLFFISNNSTFRIY